MRVVYLYIADYDIIDVADISDIHKYLMKKHYIRNNTMYYKNNVWIY